MKAYSLEPAPLMSLVSEALAAGRCIDLCCHGESMRPWIYDGDRVILSGLPAGGAQRGDVLLAWEAEQRLSLHRVIAVRGAAEGLEYQLRGDAARRGAAGVWVGQAQAAARVQQIERQGRRWRVDTLPYRLLIWAWMALPG